jgi:hypothetical protein
MANDYRGYRDELAAAELQGKVAHDAMEAWVSRPLDAPDVPGEVLENHAKELRTSRERLQHLLAEHGARDDIEAALAANQEYHRSLGLSIRGEPRPDSDDGNISC